MQLHQPTNPNLISPIRTQPKYRKMRLSWAWIEYLELEVGLDWTRIDCFLIWIKLELAINWTNPPKLQPYLLPKVIIENSTKQIDHSFNE